MALEALPEAQRQFVLTGGDMAQWIGSLMARASVIAPVPKDSKRRHHVFKVIETPEEVDLTYESTILPPKKALHLPFETLFSFEDGAVTHADDPEPQILFAVHPCDLHAIAILDVVFKRDYVDPHYVAKRNNTAIVALNCQKAGDNCFCASLGTGPSVKDPCDATLTPLLPVLSHERYLLEIHTPKGFDLVQGTGFAPAESDALSEKSEVIENTKRHTKKRINTQDILEIMEDNFRNPIWEELMEDCLGCGSCTMVCPTCFCYSVGDVVDLNLKSGRRRREWDSCMLLEYAEVAMGHNFRKDRDARIKQRMYHKLAYYQPQFGTLGCVGCGRCVTACVKKIDITDVTARLRGE